MKRLTFLKENYWLISILLFAALLRLYHVDYQSAWVDEIHTLIDCDPSMPFSHLYNELCTNDPHPPLYFIYIKICFSIFGYTTFVLRFFTALIGIAGVWAIYLLGKELYGKKIGLYAALLITVNYFQLYYSQDARPYALLFLTTTLSFYFLIRFIKSPTLKTSLLYGFFTALMTYSHLFSLFILISQVFILLYFILKPYDRLVTQKKFLLYCLLSGFVAAVLYIPNINILLWVSEIKSIWIQMPKEDVYTQMFREFFGFSEIVVFFVVISTILFFNRWQKTKQETSDNTTTNNFTLSAFILVVWILTTLLLPLIRTYTSLPMLISRYFIGILPAVVIVISVGINQIKNKLLKNIFLSAIVLFSLTDVIIVKRYYKTYTKTQFRDVANYIKANNDSNAPIVTSMAVYWPFFLNNDEYKSTIINSSFEDHIALIVRDSTQRKPFWYADAHGRPYNLSPQAEEKLWQYFTPKTNISLLDAWATYYTLKTKELKNIDLQKFGEIKQLNGEQMSSLIENYSFNGNILDVSGWAYFPEAPATDTQIQLVIIKDGKSLALPMQKIIRKDVTSYFKSEYDIDNSGFRVHEDLSELEPGTYQLGIYLINKQEKKESLLITDKIIQKN